MRAALIFIAACAISTGADARIHRDHRAVAEFKRQTPCPATAKPRGRCPGYVVDHHQALCVGGADSPANMRWMTIEAAKRKDRWECKPGWEQKLRECEPKTCGT